MNRWLVDVVARTAKGVSENEPEPIGRYRFKVYAPDAIEALAKADERRSARTASDTCRRRSA